MKEILIKKEDRLLQIINKILTSETSELKIVISEDSILFKNILNLKIFQRTLDSSQIISKIETQSEVGKKMLSQIRNKDQDEADFSRYQESLKEEEEEDAGKVLENPFEKPKIDFPKLSLPSINFSKIKLIPVALAGALVVFGFGYYFLVAKLTANIELLVSAERFVKSFEIVVSSQKNTDVNGKILRGESVASAFQATKEIQTSGKVEGGKKAQGEVKFLNKTDKTIKLSKDTKLTYKESGKEYLFILDDSVEVPARSLTSTLPETFVSGEKIEAVTASSYGSSYNIPAGKNLSVSGYTTSELSGVVSSSFEGGVKNTLNAVSEQDLKEVSSQSFEEFKSKFVFNTSASKVILKNSESFSIAGEKFSAKLSDPADKLSVTQDIVVTYLTYDFDQALSFVKASIKSLIPDGFELYGKDLQIDMASLSSSSEFNTKEYKVQLTIRSYKIPVIDEEEVKKNIAGKKLSEASSYLDSLKVNYNIESSSSLLNLFGLPKDTSKINVSITKQ